MFKKILAIVLCLSLCLILFACGNKDNSGNKNYNSGSDTVGKLSGPALKAKDQKDTQAPSIPSQNENGGEEDPVDPEETIPEESLPEETQPNEDVIPTDFTKFVLNGVEFDLATMTLADLENAGYTAYEDENGFVFFDLELGISESLYKSDNMEQFEVAYKGGVEELVIAGIGTGFTYTGYVSPQMTFVNGLKLGITQDEALLAVQSFALENGGQKQEIEGGTRFFVHNEGYSIWIDTFEGKVSNIFLGMSEHINNNPSTTTETTDSTNQGDTPEQNVE